MANKIYSDAAGALEGVLFDGMTIMAGGFGLCGIPENLIREIQRSGVKNLTVISNNAGVDGFGLGVLLNPKQVKKMISSYVGENKEFERQYLSGELELEFNPQGTLAERCRAGGAGIPAFYAKTGVGTLVAEGKETRVFNGETYVMETGLVADLAIVKAWKGDAQGNLIYSKTARNFNPMMATAGKITIAEVEEMVRAGRARPGRDPHAGHLRGAHLQGHVRETHRTAHHPQAGDSLMAWDRDQMAARAAKELKDGFYVNLGIGIPTLVANHIPEASTSRCNRRTACSAWGRFPFEGEEDPDLINAGKQTITGSIARPSSTARHRFAMIRGGHIDLADPRRDGSLGDGRSRQLDDPRQAGQGHGRRDGSGGGRQARRGHHGSRQQGGRRQAAEGVHAAADRHQGGQSHHHQSRRV